MGRSTQTFGSEFHDRSMTLPRGNGVSAHGLQHRLPETEREWSLTSSMGDALTEWLRRWIRPPGNFTIREATLREGHETSVGTTGPSVARLGRPDRCGRELAGVAPGRDRVHGFAPGAAERGAGRVAGGAAEADRVARQARAHARHRPSRLLRRRGLRHLRGARLARRVGQLAAGAHRAALAPAERLVLGLAELPTRSPRRSWRGRSCSC